MQPERDSTEDQQPKEQPQAAYPASPLSPSQAPAQPVVTLTPDDVGDTAPLTGDEGTTNDPDDQASEMEPVHWQAHEYIHHEKGFGWFAVFALVVLLLIAAAVFIIQSLTFAVLIPVMAVTLVVYSRRPPRLIDYTLSRQGFHINDRLYSFAEFRAFGVVHDGSEYSVMLLPTKRFKPGVSVYFPEEAGEAIVDMLGARLPMQEFHLDIIDKLVRKLRI